MEDSGGASGGASSTSAAGGDASACVGASGAAPAAPPAIVDEKYWALLLGDTRRRGGAQEHLVRYLSEACRRYFGATAWVPEGRLRLLGPAPLPREVAGAPLPPALAALMPAPAPPPEDAAAKGKRRRPGGEERVGGGGGSEEGEGSARAAPRTRRAGARAGEDEPEFERVLVLWRTRKGGNELWPARVISAPKEEGGKTVVKVRWEGDNWEPSWVSVGTLTYPDGKK